MFVSQGKQVTGNQEGGANVKKVRTWRQYMNRRGGFNRSAHLCRDRSTPSVCSCIFCSTGLWTRSSKLSLWIPFSRRSTYYAVNIFRLSSRCSVSRSDFSTHIHRRRFSLSVFEKAMTQEKPLRLATPEQHEIGYQRHLPRRSSHNQNGQRTGSFAFSTGQWRYQFVLDT